jgi:electron transfer flavoprotein beta subunit
MKIVVFAKLVPDLVEELTVDPNGVSLDTTWLRLIVNEFDDHAIEQGILLKDRSGASVSIVAPDFEGVDDVLFTAAAKGADQLIKLIGDFSNNVNNHALARASAAVIKELQPNLVMTGVQANNDLDGPVGPLLAEYLGMPYIGYVAGVTISDDKASIRKEYPGGLVAEMEVTLPAVLGIQAAEQPPRYVAVSKVRQAMKTSTIEDRTAANLDLNGGLTITRMFQPEVAKLAEMIEGDVQSVAARLVGIFKEAGIL